MALWAVPRHAARYANQTWHAVGPALIGALFLVLSVVVPGAVFKFAALSIAAAAIFAGQPVFWTLPPRFLRSEEHTSELQSLMRISYAVFCLKKKKPKDKLIPIAIQRNT